MTSVVHLGVSNGRIATRELPTLPDSLHYACQSKAWFDEQTMLVWIRDVLALYVATARREIVPILLLDSFKVHMKATVVSAIQTLGVEVIFIPPGCTSIIQPVDVRYNKSFKSKMKEQYNDWVLIHDPNQPTPNATRHDIVNWIINSKQAMTQDTIKNAWKRTGFSNFPGEEAIPTNTDDDEDDHLNHEMYNDEEMGGIDA